VVLFWSMNKKVLNHFKAQDPILYSYALQVGEITTREKSEPEEYFVHLCNQIICQQLSDRAGDTIFSRFKILFPHKPIKPSDVVSISHEALRATGMSHAKVRYVRNLAQDITNGIVPISKLHTMTDEDVIKTLTKVKGIGRWTAEMFLMFALCRPDVFSYGDLGLRKGIMKIYGFKKEPEKKKMEKIAQKWSPYKTYASRVLWASLRFKSA
jgi:DNA-3-methyladenine glycosylase II